MEYRQTDHIDEGFDSEDEEFEAMHDYIQGIMHNGTIDHITDSLLINARICEYRGLMHSALAPEQARWYTQVAKVLRHLLDVATKGEGNPKVNSKLENDALYFPEFERRH